LCLVCLLCLLNLLPLLLLLIEIALLGRSRVGGCQLGALVC
jgi:hypothetical protein